MVRIDLVEGANTKLFEKAIEVEMDIQLKHFDKELTKIRTGRAHSSLVEDVKVACYGTLMPLKEVAALSTPDVNLIVIQAWDKTIIADIERAIAESDLGLTPTTDSNCIRIVLPKMSTARRDELIKKMKNLKLVFAMSAKKLCRFYVMVKSRKKFLKIMPKDW